jgi:hypothetical protein
VESFLSHFYFENNTPRIKITVDYFRLRTNFFDYGFCRMRAFIMLRRTASYWFNYNHRALENRPAFLCWAAAKEALVAEMAPGHRLSAPHLVGVVVRVANHKVQPV